MQYCVAFTSPSADANAGVVECFLTKTTEKVCVEEGYFPSVKNNLICLKWICDNSFVHLQIWTTGSQTVRHI